ncbi:hypothetical protein [Dickeya oryzae]
MSSYSIQKLNNGSHEDTWSVLAELLIKVSREFLLDRNPVSQQKKQTFFNQMDELVKVMKSHPCHNRANWLSKLRNEVNYQHKHGAWYPHEKSKNFRENVFHNLTAWNKSPNLKISDETHYIDKFTQTCTFLVSLVRELIYDISSRNADDDSFLKVMALKAIKQAEQKRGSS